MIEVTRKDFVEVLSKLPKIKNNLSVLSNIVISATNNICTIKSSDLKTYVVAQIPCYGEMEEKLFNTELAKKASKVSKIQHLIITDRDIDGTPCVSNDCVEQFPEIEYKQEIFFKIADLSATIELLTPFVSDDVTRYFMNGVCIDHEEDSDTIRFIATDGRILAYKDHVDFDYKKLPTFSKICPLSAFSMPKKLLGKTVLSFGGKFSALSIIDRNISYRNYTVIIEGQFPNYKRVVPECNKSLTFDSIVLHNIIKKLFITADKKNLNKTKIQVVDNKATFTTLGDEGISLSSATIPVDSVEDFEFCVNLHNLQVCITEAHIMKPIEIHYVNSANALMVKTTDSIRLCMPMRVD